MRATLTYLIVHCQPLWRLCLHGKKGFGPYIPRFRWVHSLLDMLDNSQNDHVKYNTSRH